MSAAKTLVILLVFALAAEAKHHKVSATKHFIRTTRFRGPRVRYRFKTNALKSMSCMITGACKTLVYNSHGNITTRLFCGRASESRSALRTVVMKKQSERVSGND